VFDLTVSGKITKVFGQLAVDGDYVFSMEEDYFSNGEVHVRYYNVYVTPNEYQRAAYAQTSESRCRRSFR